MSDETSTLIGSGESLDKGQAVDLLLNVEAPEEASENSQEPVAEEVETEFETNDATFEEESEEYDAEELSDYEDESDDEEYDVDPNEVEEELYTVKIDGTEKQVTSEELVKSYQLEQAAQKRMQEAATTRKQAELEAGALLQQRQQYAQALAQVQAQLTTTEPTKEQWDRLYQEDPLEWTRQRDAYREQKETHARLQQERARVAQEQQQQMMLAQQQRLADEQVKVLERIPEWRDDSVALREKQAIITYAQRIGYTEQELSTASDSRAIEALRKAYLYDELMSKRPEAQKKVRKAPSKVKSGSPTTKRQVAAGRSKQALSRLNKTGSKEDAVNFLLERSK